MWRYQNDPDNYTVVKTTGSTHVELEVLCLSNLKCVLIPYYILTEYNVLIYEKSTILAPFDINQTAALEYCYH